MPLSVLFEVPEELHGVRQDEEGGPQQRARVVQRRPSVAPPVHPSPATHAILAQLKAGETVFQAGELPKTLRVSRIHYEVSTNHLKQCVRHLLPRFSRLQWKMVTGLGSG